MAKAAKKMKGVERTFCRLCGREGELVDSHIYPHWFIKDHLQPENGVPFVISSTPGSFPKRAPKGFSEDLLCSDCDNRVIGSLETKASEVYRSMKAWFSETTFIPNWEFRVPLRRGEDVFLFSLSLVFRAMVSANSFFRLLKDCPNCHEVASKIGTEILERNFNRQMLMVFRRDMTDVQVVISPECVVQGESVGCLIRFGHWNIFVHLCGPVFPGWALAAYSDAKHWSMYSHESRQDLEIAREIAMTNPHLVPRIRRGK
jgi:hypothetical protein